jgi:hypothetical protein
LRNIIREMGFNSVSQRFGDNFVNDITKPYRSEILRENRIRFFGMRVMKVLLSSEGRVELV